jgi:cell division protein FtsB
VPNPSGVNKRKRSPKSQEPRFLRKVFPGYGRGAPAKVLRILGWTVAVWFVSAILFGDSGLVSILRMRGMRGSLEDEIEVLEEVKAATEERRDDLKNDPETIERLAREEYGMIKDGEITYRVKHEDDE